MGSPCIAQIPGPVMVEIVDFYFAIYRAGSKAIPICVESRGLYHISMAILKKREALWLYLLGIIVHSISCK